MALLPCRLDDDSPASASEQITAPRDRKRALPHQRPERVDNQGRVRVRLRRRLRFKPRGERPFAALFADRLALRVDLAALPLGERILVGPGWANVNLLPRIVGLPTALQRSPMIGAVTGTAARKIHPDALTRSPRAGGPTRPVPPDSRLQVSEVDLSARRAAIPDREQGAPAPQLLRPIGLRLRTDADDSKRFSSHNDNWNTSQSSHRAGRKGGVASGMAPRAKHRSVGDVFRGARGERANAEEGGHRPPPSP